LPQRPRVEALTPELAEIHDGAIGIRQAHRITPTSTAAQAASPASRFNPEDNAQPAG
jgi:hypothetical protein